MRLIDADRMKGNTPNWLLETDGMRTRYLYETLDYQPTVIEGKVEDEDLAYKRTVKIKPTTLYYSMQPRYIKHICPVCEAVGNKHQLTYGEEKCPLCNVNLTWNGVER